MTPCALGREWGPELDTASACESFNIFLDRVDLECTLSSICLCFKNDHHGLVLHSPRKKTTANISVLWRDFPEPLKTAGVKKC